MHVLALTRYSPLGSSSRVRFYQYLSFLKSSGVEIQVAPLLEDDYIRNLYGGKRQPILPLMKAYLRRLGDLANGRQVDLFWIEKELFPWIPWPLEVLPFLYGIPWVVDYDDAVFHRYDCHKSWLVRALLGEKIDAIMRRAATVVAGNPYLAERALSAGAKRIEYLPSVVDTDRYKPGRKAEGTFRIGWIGSPMTAPFLGLIREALEQVTRQTGACLVLVGSGNRDPLPGLEKQVIPWSEVSEVSDIQSFDVGIMPLPDGPFERGKCGYKLIQYMACGLPVVASPVGVNRQIVRQGITGFCASSQEEWAEALVRLAGEMGLRKIMGEAGRHVVEREYSLQVTAPRLFNILAAAAAR
jgi:glycosyltransferase involved in cell wall biosynthesis